MAIGGVLPADFSLVVPVSLRDSIAVHRALDSLKSFRGNSDVGCNRAVIATQLRLAQLLWQTDRIDFAMAEYQTAVAALRSCFEPGDSLRIIGQYDLGALYADAGFYTIDDGIPYLKDALAGCDESPWCKGKARAYILRQTALALGFIGDTTSRSMLEESLKLFEVFDDQDSIEVARSLWLLRKACFEGQNLNESQVLLERLLRLHESRPQLESPSLGTLYGAYGEDIHLSGDDARAIPYFRKALDSFVNDETSSLCAIARCNVLMAQSLSNLGRFMEAKPYYKQAIQLYDNCGEVNPPYSIVSASVEYGRDLIDHGELVEAHEVLLRAREIATDSLGRGEDAHAYLLLELARLLDFSGESNLAEEYYGHALAIAENIHGLGDARVANFLEPFAEFLFENNKLSFALPLQARAEKLRESQYGKSHPLTAESLHRLSFMTLHSGSDTYQLNDQLKVAGWWQLSAWESKLYILRDAINVVPEYQLIGLSQEFKVESDRAYSMLINAPDTSSLKRLASRIIPASKAQVWDVLRLRHREYVSESDAYAQQLADSLAKVKQELSQSYISLHNSNPNENHVQRFEALATEKKRLSDELTYRSASFANYNNQYDPQAFMIASALTPGSALIEFVRYNYEQTLRKQEARYLAFAIHPDSSAILYDLGRASEIDSLVDLVAGEFTDPRNLDEAEYKLSAKKLHEKLMTPLGDTIRSARDLYICPDGELHRIAFEALCDTKGDYLVEHSRCHYLSSGRELYRIAVGSETHSTNVGLLAMGNPASVTTSSQIVFGDTTGFSESGALQRSLVISRSLSLKLFTQLPGSEREIGSIISQWTTCCAEPELFYIGKAASEERFKSQCASARVIYLATHGYSNLSLDIESVIAATDVAASSPLLIKDNPLLQSGIMLSAETRLDEVQAPGNEDGFVTAEEIADLDLHGADLVVLSACHTGTGLALSGEGVFSTCRAFQIAGAKTLVSSLWAVDDVSTEKVMSSMVAHTDQSISAALHAAMNDRIRDLRDSGASDHPYYWAGFVCSGDPRTKLCPDNSR
ncbi:MAG: CHAT domain-containing protein [Calditrichaeota bacterium]|nr:CHAT domain-containing protein [Calditrichota bacterium]